MPDNEPTLEDLAREHEGQTLCQLSEQHENLQDLADGNKKTERVSMYRRTAEEDLGPVDTIDSGQLG